MVDEPSLSEINPSAQVGHPLMMTREAESGKVADRRRKSSGAYAEQQLAKLLGRGRPGLLGGGQQDVAIV